VPVAADIVVCCVVHAPQVEQRHWLFARSEVVAAPGHGALSKLAWWVLNGSLAVLGCMRLHLPSVAIYLQWHIFHIWLQIGCGLLHKRGMPLLEAVSSEVST
jgi:hypothetical protein